MTESQDNPVAIDLMRSRQVSESKSQYAPPPADAAKPDFNAFAAAMEVVPPEGSQSGGLDAGAVSGGGAAGSATVTVPGASPVSVVASDGFRQARIIVIAVLLLLLLAVWLFRKAR